MATKAASPAISPHATPTKARPAQRVQWVDAARGLAILLVVFGHAAGGLIDASGPGTLVLLRYLFLAIYTFHMPVFFFLSGMFVEQRLQKGIPGFFAKLLATIVWPYFLWSVLQYSLIFALGSLVNHPPPNYWPAILALPWSPVSQFWFLHALFLIHLLGIAAWRIGGARAVLGAALLVKLIAMFVPGPVALSLAASNAPYYALGFILGWQRVSHLVTQASIETRLLIIAGAIAALVLLAANGDAIQPYVLVENASSAGIARVAWIPAMLPATLLGGASLLLASRALSRARGPVARVVEYLGTMTLPIFVLHVIFIAGVRIVLSKLFGLGGLGMLPLLVIAGFVGPLLLRRATDRLGVTATLGLR